MPGNKTRVPVRGTVGKSVRIPASITTKTASGRIINEALVSTPGAILGVNLSLPNGQVPTLAQLAALLASAAAGTDQPGNIGNPGGAVIVPWGNIQFVPPNVVYAPIMTRDEDYDDAPIIPGPAGKDGIIGTNGAPGVTIPMYPDEAEDALPIPGPPGPPGAAGATGATGAGTPGVTIPMFPDDAEDALPIPGPPGPPGVSGTSGVSGATGPAVFFDTDDPEDPYLIPGPQGPAGSGGGSSEPFNVTVDTHGTGVPAFVANDEFEGASLDTAGTRFTGATAWTWQQQGSSTATLTEGSLVMSGQLVAGTISAIEQPLPGGSSWTYQGRASWQGGNPGGSVQPFAGFHLRESSSGDVTGFGFIANNPGQIVLLTGTLAGGYAAIAVQTTYPYIASGSAGHLSLPWFYYQIALASGTLTYSISQTGLPGSWITMASRAVTTDFSTAPDHIGFAVRANNGSDTPTAYVDWFRQVA